MKWLLPLHLNYKFTLTEKWQTSINMSNYQLPMFLSVPTKHANVRHKSVGFLVLCHYTSLHMVPQKQQTFTVGKCHDIFIIHTPANRARCKLSLLDHSYNFLFSDIPYKYAMVSTRAGKDVFVCGVPCYPGDGLLVLRHNCHQFELAAHSVQLQ